METIHSNYYYPFLALIFYMFGRFLSLIFGSYYLFHYNDYLFHSNLNDTIARTMLLDLLITPISIIISFIIAIKGRDFNIKPIIYPLFCVLVFFISLYFERDVQKITRSQFENNTLITLRTAKIKDMLEKNSTDQYDFDKLLFVIKTTIIKLYQYTVYQIIINIAFLLPSLYVITKIKTWKLLQIVDDPRVVEYRKTKKLYAKLPNKKYD